MDHTCAWKTSLFYMIIAYKIVIQLRYFLVYLINSTKMSASSDGNCMTFEEEEIDPVTFNKEIHPLKLYISGDIEIRGDIILNHPEIHGYIYLHKEIVSKLYLPTKIINFKATDKVIKNIIVVVACNRKEYTPLCIPEILLLSDNLHFTDSDKFKKDIIQSFL